jgi:hypothetical protein
VKTIPKILIGISVVAGAAWLKPKKQLPQEEAVGTTATQIQIYTAAREHVSKHLRLAATAAYSDSLNQPNTGCVQLGRDHWYAWGWVVTNTLAGGKEHSKWRVVMTEKPPRRVIHWDLGGRPAGKFPTQLAKSQPHKPASK